jgi:hypothetical protein
VLIPWVVQLHFLVLPRRRIAKKPAGILTV